MSGVDFGALKDSLKPGSGSGFKPKPGENKIRVLWPTRAYLEETARSMSFHFRSHFVKKVEGRDLVVFRCLRDFDQSCPACEFFFRHRKDDDAGVAAVAGDFGNSQRFIMNILDLNNVEGGVQRFETGPQVHNGILEYVANERWGNCMHPGPDGRNFFVRLIPANESGTGYNKYVVEPDPEKSSVLDLLPPDWVDQLDGLEDHAAETWDANRIAELVHEAKVQVGLAANAPFPGAAAPAPAPQAPPAAAAPTPAAPQQPSAPAPQPTAPAEATPAAAPTPAPAPTPTATGPEIGPDGNPVCFGGWKEREEKGHPCDGCGAKAKCQLVAYGLQSGG